jgi:hypothetical protein
MRLRNVLLPAQRFEMSRIHQDVALNRKTRANLSQEMGRGKASMRRPDEPFCIQAKLMRSASVH